MSANNGATQGAFDLAVYRATQAEVTHETFKVKLGTNEDGSEDSIEFPELRQWPMESQVKFGAGDIVGALTMMVGDEQFAKFYAYRWTLGEIEALFEAMSKWSGFQMGQPSAQPPALGLTRMSS